jgi:hypothetical protein
MPIRRTADGIELALRVTPKASADRLQGLVAIADGAGEGFAHRLKIQVTAPPADGAANAAVVKLLAKALRLPKTSLAITSGAGARHKVVRILGEDPAALEARVRDALRI